MFYSYGGGTHPWNKGNSEHQSMEDGFIEVVGLTTYQLVSIHRFRLPEFKMLALRWYSRGKTPAYLGNSLPYFLVICEQEET